MKIHDPDNGVMTSTAEDPNGTDKNPFFVIKWDDKAITMKIFSETDKGLEGAFENPNSSLPTGE